MLGILADTMMTAARMHEAPVPPRPNRALVEDLFPEPPAGPRSSRAGGGAALRIKGMAVPLGLCPRLVAQRAPGTAAAAPGGAPGGGPQRPEGPFLHRLKAALKRLAAQRGEQAPQPCS